MLLVLRFNKRQKKRRLTTNRKRLTARKETWARQAAYSQ
jgi:hypothetical protein